MEIIYHHFETLSSTNDWIKAQLKSVMPNTLLVVSAEAQTAARGQYGRRWLSPKRENLYASFGFFVDETQDPLSLTRLMALSAARALGKYQVNCQIKWPNDLMIDAKKIGGILCETETFPTQLGITLGIGLNVNMSQKNINLIDQPATSILLETGVTHTPLEILFTLKEYFAADLDMFLSQKKLKCL